MKKIFLILLAFVIIAPAIFASDNEFKNILVNVDFEKTAENAYRVNLTTQNPYVDEIKVVKKSDYNYYILLAETYSKPIAKKIDANLGPVEIQLFPYAEQDLNNGYTKITFNTTKPTDFAICLTAKSSSQFPITDLVKIAKLNQMYEQKQTTVKGGKVLLAKTTPQPTPQTSTKPVAKTVTAQQVAKAEPKTTVQPTQQPATKIAVQPKPVVQPVQRPEPKATTQPTQQPATKIAVQPKPVVQPIQQPIAKIATQPEVKPAVKPELKVEMKPEAKSAKTKTELKPVISPEKPQVQAMKKPAALPVKAPEITQKPVVIQPKAEQTVLKPVESAKPQTETKLAQTTQPKVIQPVLKPQDQLRKPALEEIVQENMPQTDEEQSQIEQDELLIKPVAQEQQPKQPSIMAKLVKTLKDSPLQIALLLCSLIVLLVARIQISRIKKGAQNSQQKTTPKQPQDTPQPQQPTSYVSRSAPPLVQPDTPRSHGMIRPKEEIYEEILEENIYQTPRIVDEPIEENISYETPQEVIAAQKAVAEATQQVETIQLEDANTAQFDEIIEERFTAEKTTQEMTQEPEKEIIEEINEIEVLSEVSLYIEELQELNVQDLSEEPLHKIEEITEELPEEKMADEDIIQPVTINFAQPEINESVFTEALNEPGISQMPQYGEYEPQRQQVPQAEIRRQTTTASTTVTNPQKRIASSERAKIISSVRIENDRGFFLADYRGVKALVGYILDDIFIIHSFKNQEIRSTQIDFRLSETTKDGDFYLVRVNGSTLLVKSAKDEMSLSNFVTK